MKALILCAGLGTRLKPITDKIPKCMVRVGGKPVLEHLVFHLWQFGINQIVVNLHHKHQIIMDYFGERLLYLYEPQLLGEERTIECLRNWTTSDYMVVMNGDTLTNIDIKLMFTMCGGKNIKSMDKNIFTGTKILGPRYFYLNDRSFVNYSNADTYWQDIGTHKGLKKARDYYEKLNNLPKV